MEGETQDIEAVLNQIARKYLEEQEQCQFQDQEQVYLVAYLAIMLNTNLHRTIIKDKFTK